ncbi:putative transposase [Pseudomonas syringae pv. berberidis]|nr:putative transposase [Pseudomonas syringae pv. berberidis]
MPNLDQMPPEQLRTLAAQLMSKVDTMGRKIHRDETIIEQLTHEIAILKRHKFAKRSEQISPAQGSLLDDLLNTDLQAIEAELKALHPAPAQAEPRQQPKRAPLPPQFPRTVIHHEPDNTQCACGCQLQRIGEDVSEKLDYTAVQANMRVTSWAPGTASWSVMTLPVTRPASSWASPKSAAWPMRAASSSTCTLRIKVSWRSRRFTRLVDCMSIPVEN